MSFSTYEELRALWGYLEKIDPSEKQRAKGGAFIRKDKTRKLLDAIRQWKPDGTPHQHAIASTILAYLNEWGGRRRVARGVMIEAAKISLGIIRSDWNPKEHGFEGMAVIREAFWLVRDHGHGVQSGRVQTDEEWLERFDELLAIVREDPEKKAGK